MVNQKEIAYRINTNGCWICTSHKTTGIPPWNYPTFKRSLKRIKISRFMFEKHKKDIPKDKIIRHLCDNTPCINPDHLTFGTWQENMDDLVKSGNSLKGEKNPNSKLTTKTVDKIYDSILSNKKLAQRYNISIEQIRNIRTGRSWKHLCSKAWRDSRLA